MKKSSFAAMILGTISVIFSALGMCMTMLERWNVFHLGIILGVTGLVFALITVIVWRRMEHKEPIQINGKTVGIAALGIIGALALRCGMCLVMVWGNLVPGIIIGLIGILLLLRLIPFWRGILNQNLSRLEKSTCVWSKLQW